MIKAPTLQNDVVRLEPFKGNGDREYLLELAMKYKHNTQTREEMKTALNLAGHLFWTVYIGTERVGTVWTSYVNGFGFSIDGYRDDELCRGKYNRSAVGMETCRLVTDFMLGNVTDTLHAITPKLNRASRIMCKALGYKFMKRINSKLGELYILVKSKEGPK